MNEKDKLYFITLTSNYLKYLGIYENKVSLKANRPFIGIVFKVNNKEYFAPLSSPKEKHKRMKTNIDFFKIDKGNLGIINFNNMIPVINNDICRNKLDLEMLSKSLNTDDIKYFRLLKNQLKYCEKNKNIILAKAEKIYNIFTKNLEKLSESQKKMYRRVNNFKVLEHASKEFENEYITESL
ncbi:type III toxin-antitoxin system ToxN/AbiQ family toxin [Leptotrichia massiliensis]|jgi:abiQ|uniref:type III toxin-antitoxin system ToxN/AbiQ family toxin n=1 Tax=Leptotrichia massiliensis TaxID=1852388 RepID=UPI0008DA51B9|nr:type III toxin-antitoxin system ToxN/AbiQ family toxin [Leptotrichia massiliensis]